MGAVTLRRALADCRRLLLDTMVFSYHLGGHPRYSALTAAVLERVESGQAEGLTTTITLAELLTRPAQQGDADARDAYETYLLHFPNLTIVPLDLTVARETATVRADTGLRTPDAIQIAAARVHHADAIVTNDRRWASTDTGVRVILLDDHLRTDQ